MATASARPWDCAGYCVRSAKTPRSSFTATCPPAYRDLPGADEIKDVREVNGKYDAVFVIECSDLDRPGIKGLDNVFTVNIDHHATSEQFGTINWIDSTASAVGEMIYNLCKAIGGRITKEIAECVYMALVTDTGSFHFPNTSDRTLKVASELIKAGAEPTKIGNSVYYNYPWSRIELMRQVLATVKRDETGPRRDDAADAEMERNAATVDGDNSGFVNIPLAAKRCSRRRLHARGRRQINTAQALARRATSMSPRSPKNSAAAVTEMPPASAIEGDWDEKEREIVAALQEAIDGRRRSRLTAKYTERTRKRNRIFLSLFLRHFAVKY